MIRVVSLLKVLLLLPLFSSGGFAAYDIYDVESCSQKVYNFNLSASGSQSSVILQDSHNGPVSRPVSCDLFLSAPNGSGVIVSVQQLDLQDANRSCLNYLKIYMTPEDTEGSVLCYSRVDHLEKRSFVSPSNVMRITYHKEKEGKDENFKAFVLIATAYKQGSHRTKDSFRCSKGRHIWKGLICDGHNNCGDLLDEIDAGCGYSTTKTLKYIFISIAICIGGVVMVGGVFYVCCRPWSTKPTNCQYSTFPTPQSQRSRDQSSDSWYSDNSDLSQSWTRYNFQ